jgi:hypothetical protein
MKGARHGDATDGDSAAAFAEGRPSPQNAGEAGTPRAATFTFTKHDQPERPPVSSPTGRRLGPVECILVALIALGVAITLAMAIVNP